MTKAQLPTSKLKISKRTARRFLLAHHGLWPPRKMSGKAGVLNYIRRVGCIQYDTINVVGRNADLVLQSRVRNYRAQILDELLYKERALWDGNDKVASIYAATDWPYFTRRRERMRGYQDDRFQKALEYSPKMLEALRHKGPLSSIDFDQKEKVEWFWGNETKLARAALETLFMIGEVGVDHKVGTRRVYDLVERLLPEETRNGRDPNSTFDEYMDWHILRRISGLGLAHAGAGERWGGILGRTSEQRKEAIGRLVDAGKITAVEIEEIPGQVFFMRSEDRGTLDKVSEGRQPSAQAAFIAPLDNLMWDRRAIEWLFGFEYVWEVYKPKKQREYGYYVLPVIYGDQFVARMDAKYDRKSQTLHINDWWWQAEVNVDDKMTKALSMCLKDFGKYLGAEKIVMSRETYKIEDLDWVVKPI